MTGHIFQRVSAVFGIRSSQATIGDSEHVPMVILFLLQDHSGTMFPTASSVKIWFGRRSARLQNEEANDYCGGFDLLKISYPYRKEKNSYTV